MQVLERYQKDYVIDSSQWISKRLDQNIIFVPMELKEGKNDNLILDDLLHDIQDGMRILFTGRPGVGKTTITRYLSKHIYNFVLIIKLHLGALNGPINDLDTLLKIHGDKSFLSVDIALISSFIQRTNGKGMCFLLDGYDEYVPTRHGNYIYSLIKGDELPKSVVIVTSRPSAVEDIKYLFEKKIEIIGFAESGISAYLGQLQLSDDQNETIYQYLDYHPNVKQMCYLPLHLSMLVHMIINTDNSDLPLVNTETKLYYNFLALTIAQYEHVRHERGVESLKECFSDPNTQTDLCDILRSISEIAFDGLRNRTQMFTSSSLTGLSRIANVSAEIEALSIFKIDKSYHTDGSMFYEYWYSHPTFQEFLAAFHLTTLSREVQRLYYLNIELKYWLTRDEIYNYYFGLIRSMSKYDDETILITFIEFAKHMYPYHTFYIMKCAYEAGGDSQYIPYLQTAGILSQNNSLLINLLPRNSYDCWYLGYILAQIPLHELKFLIFTQLDVTLCLSSIIKYLSFSGDANVTKLVIEDIFVTNAVNIYRGSYRKEPIDILQIIRFLSVFQMSSTYLKLSFIIDQIDNFLQLGKVLKSFNMLQSLSLLVDVRVIKEGHLENLIRDLALLRHLELGLYNNYDLAIPNNLLEFKILKQLQSLMLEICFDYANTTKLLGGLKYLINLETLSVHLHSYKSRNNDTKELLLGIQEVRSINNLTLKLYLYENNDSRDVNIKELVEVLRSLRLLLINLSLHSIDSHGAVELAYLMSSLTELQELSLTWYRINLNAAMFLGDKYRHLHNLRTLKFHLNLKGCCNELMVIFPFNLLNLDFKCEEIGGYCSQTAMKKLLNELKDLKQLQQLILSGNRIGDDDMEPLAEALKEMNNLHTLDLSHNYIGDDGMKLLAELFDPPQRYLHNLQVLLLNDNKYSEVGAKFLVKKLNLLQLHTIEFNSELTVVSAEVLVLRHQQKVKKMPEILTPPTSPFSISEMITFMLKQLHSHKFSVILGIAVLGLSLFFKPKASKNIIQSTELSRALSCSSFSVSDAWDLRRLESINLNGTGTVIAILDTAINQSFPSFIGKKILDIRINEHFPSIKGEEILVIDCLPMHVPVASSLDATMHGTIGSAIAVGSQCDTTSGVVPRGVAPGAQLIVYRIAEGDYAPTEAILGALDDIWNRLQSNIQIDVVSISYHYDVNDQQLQVFHDKIKILTEMGVTFVAAAGNRGGYQALACIPARFYNVISVGALDKNGKRSSLTPQVKIDVYAPGEDIKFPTSDEIFWGTSYATPAVAGLVLLLKEWANFVGGSAKENIHRVDILREIFKKDMFVKSDSTDNHIINILEPGVKLDSDGTVMIFDPVEFFMSMKDSPTMLNDIVKKYLDKKNVMDH